MKKIILSLGFCVLLSQPAVAAFQSTSGLLSQCISPDNAQYILCAAYLKSTADTLEELESSGNLQGRKYCGLNRASVGQLVDSFVSEAKAHPEKSNQRASGTVLSALDKVFNCK